MAERVEQVRNLYHGGDMRILSDNNAKKFNIWRKIDEKIIHRI